MTLGFCDAKPKYIYIGGETCWYFWGDGKAEPIKHNGLTCRIISIDLVDREYKNETNTKLIITVEADGQYKLQAGMSTWFSKSILPRLMQLSPEDFRHPLTISVKEGSEQNIVFASLQKANKDYVLKPEDFDYKSYENESTIIEHVAELQKKINESFRISPEPDPESMPF